MVHRLCYVALQTIYMLITTLVHYWLLITAPLPSYIRSS